jgi:hypothetical protein
MMKQLAAPELAKAAKPMQGPDFGSDSSNTPFSARCPFRVNRAALTVRRSLPVYPE